MSDIVSMIMRDIEEDVTLQVSGLAVELQSKGILGRRKCIRLTGTVKSDLEREKIGRIAAHHAGDAYEVVNETTLRQEPQPV